MISRQISGSGSDTALIALVAPASPRISSLGAVVNDILANSPDGAFLFVDLKAATVQIGAGITGTPDSSMVINPVGVVRALTGWRSGTAASGLGGFVMGTVTPTTPGSTDLGAILAEALDPNADPSFSLGAVVDAIDRAFQASETASQIVIAINQAGEDVDVYEHTSNGLSMTTPTATFTATAPVPAAAQWGE
jgi:hypothetical protein